MTKVANNANLKARNDGDAEMGEEGDGENAEVKKPRKIEMSQVDWEP